MERSKPMTLEEAFKLVRLRHEEEKAGLLHTDLLTKFEAALEEAPVTMRLALFQFCLRNSRDLVKSLELKQP